MTAMTDMTGQVALCTGAAGGIGRATALLFARRGATVYAADLVDADQADVEVGDRLRYRQLDVRDETAVASLVDHIAGEHGQLDVAFNNAGVLLPSLDAEWEVDSFERCLAVNVTGVMVCMKHELRIMEPQGFGAIVNTASIAGIVGLPRSVAYAASKHAVVGMTKAAALGSAGAGVRINAVCPGPTETAMIEVAQGRRAGATSIPGVPLGRRATADEIAEAVVWLASDASSYVTGHSLVVDGGYVAG
jgi:NAD(P)-dependent dehydrogenase (short-subunit alcohol dehydrogenase family)